jgi:hypothetical protein
MTSEKVLEITGHAGVPVPNLFFKQSTSSNRLALLLPGARYTVDMPVLYYTSLILQAHGIDVLEVKYDYDRPAFLSAAPDERLAWIYDDIYASWQAGLAAGKYQHFILTGKSIGTLGMALLLNRHRELSSCSRANWKVVLPGGD